jgi:hypothetical protein
MAPIGWKGSPMGQSDQVYAAPQNGAADPSQVSNAVFTRCRNATTDSRWPAAMSCPVPTANTEFTVRARPGP